MILLAILLAGLVGFGLFVASRPANFRIQRTAILPASSAIVHSHIDDFRQWANWSPWESLDPNLQRQYLGPTSGVGSIYTWSGNGKAGAGRMTIVSSDPTRIVLQLEFLRPFKATNTATFQLAPEADGTRVDWIMEGNNGFIMKLFSIVFDSEKFVGKDFEKGLASLSTLTASKH